MKQIAIDELEIQLFALIVKLVGWYIHTHQVEGPAVVAARQ